MATSQLAVASGLDFVNPQPAGPVPAPGACKRADDRPLRRDNRQYRAFFGGWVPIPSKMNLSQERCD
jgi:hypothetical protein